MSRALLLGTCLLAAGLMVLPSGPSLYVYIPNFLVVSNEQEADVVLADLEASQGVQAAYDPIWADRPDLKRLDREAAIMEKHWKKLDAKCDHNAVFALMYLYTTYGVRRNIRDYYFEDNDYLSIITVSFANMYLSAWDMYVKGDLSHVPQPWLKAFQASSSGMTTITEDELLGMNAHINYDLGIAEASLGTTSASGQSRKPDMDRINHVLSEVTDEVGYMIALYYGPSPPTTQPNWGAGESQDPASLAVLEGIYGWREQAWGNARAIETMPAPLRPAHDAEMQTYAGTVATGIVSPKTTSPAPERLAYCMANP